MNQPKNITKEFQEEGSSETDVQDRREPSEFFPRGREKQGPASHASADRPLFNRFLLYPDARRLYRFCQLQSEPGHFRESVCRIQKLRILDKKRGSLEDHPEHAAL